VICDADLAPDGLVVCVEPKRVWVWSGSSWKEVTPPRADSFEDIAADPRDAGRWVVTANNGGHYRTADAGARWVGPLPVKRNSPDIPWLAATDERWFSTAEVVFDAHVKGRLWTAQGIGVWRSDDLAGKDSIAWTSVSKGIEELCCNDLIAPPGGRLIVAVWDRTAFRIDDPDTYAAVQIPNSTFSSGWSLAYQPDRPQFVVLTAYRHNWWFGKGHHSGWSDDGGKTWHTFQSIAANSHPAELRFGDVAVSARDPDNIVRVPDADKMPYFTTDRGKTWTRSRIPEDDKAVTKGGYGGDFVKKEMLVADPSQAHTFLLSHWEHGLFGSTDGGKTFVFHSAQVPRWRWHPCLKAVDGRAGHFWFAPGKEDSGRGPLLQSVDGGATWKPVKTIDKTSVIGFGEPAPGPVAMYLSSAGEFLSRADRPHNFWFHTHYLNGIPPALVERFKGRLAVLDDADILAGRHKDYRVLLCPLFRATTDQLRDCLKEYQAAGGILVGDTLWRVSGLTPDDVFPGKDSTDRGIPYANAELPWWHEANRDDIMKWTPKNLGREEEAFALDSPSPDMIFSLRKMDDVLYAVVVNARFVQGKWAKQFHISDPDYKDTGQPQGTVVTVRAPADAVVYDATHSRRLAGSEFARAGGRVRIPTRLPPAGASSSRSIRWSTRARST